MKKLEEILLDKRFRILNGAFDGISGTVYSKTAGSSKMVVIASWAGGWEHVSVSLKKRCPTWEEMCMVKDIFFREDECVAEFHPPKKDYVDLMPTCLHMWKKVGQEYELPPKEFV